MHPKTHRLLLPLAAVSMISLPTSARALAFVTGGTVARLKGGYAVLAGRASSSSNRQAWRARRPRMELAVDSKPAETVDVVVEGLAGKTPASKLLYAPPKFTPEPYE